MPPDPEDIATVGNGGVVIVVSARAGVVTALNRDTLRTIRTFRGFDEPHIAAVAPDGQYAYITDDARGTLTVIQLSDMKVTSTVAVGSGAHHLSFSPDEHRVWVALGRISQPDRDPRHDRPRSSRADRPLQPRLSGPRRVLQPRRTRGLVSSSAGPDVTAFDPRSHRVLYRVPVGPSPQHIAFDGRFAYLTSGYGDTIEKVDANTGRVIARARAPYGSFELAAADGYVATASLLRGTLAVFTPALKRAARG